jgi:hypothetical protein
MGCPACGYTIPPENAYSPPPDHGWYYDLRWCFEANPHYVKALRSRLSPEDQYDLDRLVVYAPQLFGRNDFTQEILELLDPWLNAKRGPAVEPCCIPGKEVADLVEQAVTGRTAGKPVVGNSELPTSQPGSDPHRHPSTPDPTASSTALPALSKTGTVVLSIIKKLPKGKGIIGKEIIKKLQEKGIELEDSTLRRHLLPQLRLHGVVNIRGAGGYLIPPREE